jgi:5-methyltetrahydrofolate--homocysteine methyltransferase
LTREVRLETILRSAEGSVVIGPGHRFVIIGERINPTGRPELADELRRGDFTTARSDAIAQVQAGAQVLDLNVGAAGVEEVRVLPELVAAVQEVVDVPLCIDSAMPAALEAALDACDGKPLVNSVTAEEESLGRVLPLIGARDAAVVGLAHGAEGISSNAHDRLESARRIADRAAQLGIAPEDVVIDPLAMSVGVDDVLRRDAELRLRTSSSTRWPCPWALTRRPARWRWRRFDSYGRS